MGWVQWLLVVGLIFFAGWGAIFWTMERRAGSHKLHYSDGCPKPLAENALRADGSRKSIIPRPGDGEVDDLEHLLEHRKSVGE